MNRWPPLLLLPLLLPLLLLPGCDPTPVDDDDSTTAGPQWQPLSGSLQAVLDDEAASRGATGAAVAIWYDGVLYAGVTGTKSPDGGDAVEPSTLFRVGSTNKMMTATALLAASDRGEVALTDAVVDYFPGLDIGGAPDFADVTLHHLLSHTSGISEITPLNGVDDDAALQSFTTGQFGFSAQTYMMAPAGSFWNYSNPNFSLAGAVNEVATGRSYRTLMREDVFAPLGMDRTLFLGSEVADDGDFAESETYDWDNPGSSTRRVASAESYDHTWSRPAGFAWSSVLDMVQFGRFLMDGDTDVISAARHADLVANHVDMQAYGDYASYGYGVMSWRERDAGGEWYAVATREHNGAIPGYAADLVTVPTRGLVMVTLAAGDGAYFGELRAAVFEELLGATGETVPEVPADPADNPNYVGTFATDYNVGDMIVTMDGDGDLEWELPLFDDNSISYDRALVPIAHATFRSVLNGNPLAISFVAEDGTQEGPARWLRHRAFVGDKEGTVTREAPAGPPRAPDVRPPMLR